MRKIVSLLFGVVLANTFTYAQDRNATAYHSSNAYCVSLPNEEDQQKQYVDIFAPFRIKDADGIYKFAPNFNPALTPMPELYLQKVPQLISYLHKVIDQHPYTDREKRQSYVESLAQQALTAHNEGQFTLLYWKALNLAAAVVLNETYDESIKTNLFEASIPERWDLVSEWVKTMSEEEHDIYSVMDVQFGFIAILFIEKGVISLSTFRNAFGDQMPLAALSSPKASAHGGIINSPWIFLTHDFAHALQLQVAKGLTYRTFKHLHKHIGANPSSDDELAFFMLMHEIIPYLYEYSSQLLQFKENTKTSSSNRTYVDLNLQTNTPEAAFWLFINLAIQEIHDTADSLCIEKHAENLLENIKLKSNTERLNGIEITHVSQVRDLTHVSFSFHHYQLANESTIGHVPQFREGNKTFIPIGKGVGSALFKLGEEKGILDQILSLHLQNIDDSQFTLSYPFGYHDSVRNFAIDYGKLWLSFGTDENTKDRIKSILNKPTVEDAKYIASNYAELFRNFFYKYKSKFELNYTVLWDQLEGQSN